MRWHLITGEYPPAIGGVGDYTKSLAEAFARGGDEVQVWVPASEATNGSAVRVHRLPDKFGPRSILDMDRGIERAASSRILLQYVPHAFGLKAMNLPLCVWLATRQRERLNVIFHEVAYPMARNQSARHNVLGMVTRAMAAMLARSARHIFVTTLSWEPLLRSISRTRKPISWIPIFNSIPVLDDEAGVNAIRRRVAPGGGKIAGHFGAYGSVYAAGNIELVGASLSQNPDLSVLLIGKGGTEFRQRTIDRHPAFASRIHATGELSPADVSRSIAACDLMLQHYPSGVSTRQSSCIAALEHGRPIVTTSGPLSEPLWLESNAVAMAPARDISALAALTTKLIADAGERQRLATAARELYDRRFDIRHTLATMRAAFNGAVQK